MFTKRLMSFIVATVFVLGVLTTGCTPPPSINGDKGKGSSVSVNIMTEPPQMSSVITTDNTSFNVIRHVLEGLVRLDKDNNPVPGVAEKWDISADKLKYTFKLRDTKWSDGTPVKASDFEFAWKEVLNKNNLAGTPSEYAYIMYMIKGAQAYNEGKGKPEDVGVEAIDDKTLEVKLDKPTPYFLGLCAFGVFMPVPKDFYNKVGKKYGTEADKLLYNGPWVMKEWVHSDKIVLEKNPKYWNSAEIKLDNINMLMVKDSNAMLNKFIANELDMTIIFPEQVKKAKEEGFEPKKFSEGVTAYFEINLKNKFLTNKNIRKALAMATDKESLCKKVMEGLYDEAYCLTGSGIKGQNDKFAKEIGQIQPKYNVGEAKKAWAQGLKELKLTAAPKISMICDDDDAVRKIAQAYQGFWKSNLGFNVDIVQLTFKARLQKMTDKDFDIVMALWGPDYNDPMTFLDMLETTNGNNHTSFSNKQYDTILGQIRKETQTAKRFQLFKQLEQILADELPLVPVYYRNRLYVEKPQLKGLVRDTFQDINLYWAYVEKK